MLPTRWSAATSQTDAPPYHDEHAQYVERYQRIGVAPIFLRGLLGF